MASLLSELKRRNVFKVGVAYAIVAWLLIQIVTAIEMPLNLPDWVDTLTILLLAIGFPVALIFAWAFELTPEGIKTTKSINPTESITRQTGQKLNYFIMGVMALAILFLVIDNYVLNTEGPDMKSIAVLPFVNRSINEEDAFFADGIHDDIISQLAKIASLKVISRTSVMSYQDTTKNMRTIGEELGVATLLEGGVQRAGDQVRINMQLIDAETDEHLWSDTYDRELTTENIFAIQSEIATAIADALQATLSPREQERLGQVPTQNMAALEAYFRGRQEMASRASEGLDNAIAYFQEAINLDPDFALAYVGLADAYLLQTFYTGLPFADRSGMIEETINQALALNDELGEAYASLSWLKYNIGDFDGAEIAVKSAVELNPNFATAYHRYGILTRDQGRIDEAMVFYNKALELDPRSPIINMSAGIGLAGLGRFEEALAQFEKMIDIAPEAPIGYQGIGWHNWLVSGRLDDAVRWYRRLSNVDTNTPRYNLEHILVLWDLGNERQLECWVNHNLEVAPNSVFTYWSLQILYSVHRDEALSLEAANNVLLAGASPFDRHWFLMSLELIRNRDLAQREFAKARDHYATYYPSLFSEMRPTIDFTNYLAAIDLARVLHETSEMEQANQLLNDSLAYIQGIPRLGRSGYGISDVEIYALQGETEKALTALQQAIDSGWRSNWRYSLEINPNLDSIRNEPEFQSMVEEIRTDMADQLLRVREMEPIGQICSGA